MNPDKTERKLITDFYMWMVENDYDHNIRIRVESKAELFLRDRELVKNQSLGFVMPGFFFLCGLILKINDKTLDKSKIKITFV